MSRAQLESRLRRAAADGLAPAVQQGSRLRKYTRPAEYYPAQAAVRLELWTQRGFFNFRFPKDELFYWPLEMRCRWKVGAPLGS